ncbi:MAG: gephyrin-like molybdotransferase Glp [Chloroflexota bacterium]
MAEHHGQHGGHRHGHDRPHAHPPTEGLLSVEEALERVLGLVSPLHAVEVPLLEADGLALAEDVLAPFDIPGMDNSAMDGYAVRSEDVSGSSTGCPVTLAVVGQVQAGALPTVGVGPGQAVRIMTGAPMPKGADAIVPWEFTDEPARRAAGGPITQIAITHPVTEGEHLRPAGEDLARGERVLGAGTVLTPPALGLLASVGRASVRAVRRPRVAVLATGDEVLAPGAPYTPGRLYDANSMGIAAALRRWGAEPVLLGIARDDRDDLRAKVRAGLDADMLITSAGVSAGAFDYVKEVLAELGSMAFWAVKMRPARPIAGGLLTAPDGRRVPHLGLPGNPVSALVALVEFARPAVAVLRGAHPEPLPRVRAVLADGLLNPDGRRVYARVVLERTGGRLVAHLTGSQGSNLLTSMAAAHGLAICPEDEPQRPAGAEADVELLDWLPSPLRDLQRREGGPHDN